jgi:hypothetical protein
MANNPKISGKKLAQFNGLTIYAELIKPKRTGKLRVRLQIRQDETHDLHVEQCLNYGRSMDVLYATDTLRNSDGLIV